MLVFVGRGRKKKGRKETTSKEASKQASSWPCLCSPDRRVGIYPTRLGLAGRALGEEGYRVGSAGGGGRRRGNWARRGEQLQFTINQMPGGWNRRKVGSQTGRLVRGVLVLGKHSVPKRKEIQKSLGRCQFRTFRKQGKGNPSAWQSEEERGWPASPRRHRATGQGRTTDQPGVTRPKPGQDQTARPYSSSTP